MPRRAQQWGSHWLIFHDTIDHGSRNWRETIIYRYSHYIWRVHQLYSSSPTRCWTLCANESHVIPVGRSCTSSTAFRINSYRFEVFVRFAYLIHERLKLPRTIMIPVMFSFANVREQIRKKWNPFRDSPPPKTYTVLLVLGLSTSLHRLTRVNRTFYPRR